MPLMLHRSLMRDVQMGIWEITESEPELKSRLQLNDAELAFLATIKVERKRLQWLASRCVVRFLLCTPEFIAMNVSPSGQPLITSMQRNVSITHSGKFAGAMVSSQQAVGLDLEEVSDKVMAIRHKFINEAEDKFLDANDSMSTLVAWSAKEALFKWYGKGEVDFRKNMTLHPFELKSRGVIKAVFAKPDLNRLLNVEYEVSGEVVMTWVYG